ncbi:MAG: class I SAM-dependent methyltransferase [Proteobacteria bacterium]|nr:class I SAM-dependent methyltransferase [Pseudomonadota bacterium]HQR04966.1 class I SAM-dependent methyltransferase [Rhodocyclaceae bacterium]
MGFYDRHILPRLIDWACGMEVMQAQRQRAVPLARGTVLEVGIGSGHNLPFYDASRVQRVIGVDPGETLLAMARERSAAMPFTVDLHARGCESLPLENASVDTVLVTFALCTIPGVETALGEMRRVLRPGGQFIFCEHGRAPEPGLQRWQDRLDPLWKRCFGGCHLNRDMGALVRGAGFTLERMEAGYLPDTPRIAGYVSLGIAHAT